MSIVNVDELETFDVNSLNGQDPEQIAQIIFAHEPKNKCSIQIIGEDSDSATLFEILLTIFMEGIMLLYHNLENVSISDITYEHLYALNPWFNSFGFRLIISEIDTNMIETSKDCNDCNDCDDHYCRIILKESSYKPFFLHRNIVKNYTYFLNSIYKDGCNKENLIDIYATFKKDGGNLLYKIHFDNIQ